MCTPEEVNEKLTECSELLVECAYLVGQLPFLRTERATFRVGKALWELHEIRSALYERHPELKPELWDAPPTEQHFSDWFAEAKKLAAEHCLEGNPQEAVRTFESFVGIGPSQAYKDMAQREISKIRKEYGV